MCLSSTCWIWKVAEGVSDASGRYSKFSSWCICVLHLRSFCQSYNLQVITEWRLMSRCEETRRSDGADTCSLLTLAVQTTLWKVPERWRWERGGCNGQMTRRKLVKTLKVQGWGQEEWRQWRMSRWREMEVCWGSGGGGGESGWAILDSSQQVEVIWAEAVGVKCQTSSQTTGPQSFF